MSMSDLPADKEGFPLTVIFETADLLDAFLGKVEQGAEIIFDHTDITEILTQIFTVLLNGGPDTMIKLSMLPDFNRMVSGHKFDPALKEKINRATSEMALAILQRAMDLRGWRDNGFPYGYSRMIGKDVVLFLIPY